MLASRAFPVLVIHGVKDKIAPPAYAQRLARDLNAGCALLPGAHVIYREAAREVNALLFDVVLGDAVLCGGGVGASGGGVSCGGGGGGGALSPGRGAVLPIPVRALSRIHSLQEVGEASAAANGGGGGGGAVLAGAAVAAAR